ncbi:MAG: tRNA (adenosine(37)-N6)-threonylcarbamoyltransferase complex transferase subunit TsaD [Bacteroidota bacterium]
MSATNITILAIESSCDDTSASVISNGQVLSNVITSQKVHELYGGVVPELASRAHQANIVPVVDLALKQAGKQLPQMDAIAFTQSPGLIGSLMVGASFAKSLAQTLQIPLIAVNHMQAHILAHFIDEPKPDFPFLCLTVSGGHTQIAIMHSYFESEIIGKTIDDAAGEAFDKAAKMLELPYPGGPLVDKYAQQGEVVYEFAKPNIPGLDYSFSGLKTSFLYFLKKEKLQNEHFITENRDNICASIQQSIINHLMKKLVLASQQTGIKNIALAGGVSANSGLRKAIEEAGVKYKWNTFIPAFQYCTDNAGMIAMTAHYKYIANDFVDLAISPSAR